MADYRQKSVAENAKDFCGLILLVLTEGQGCPYWRLPLSAPTTLATTPDPSIEDDCRQSLYRLQPVQGEQGQIQQVDDAVAVDVAGEAALVAGIRDAIFVTVRPDKLEKIT